MHPSFICAYYNPKQDKLESLQDLHRSIEEVKPRQMVTYDSWRFQSPKAYMA